jgi:uncharacterized membrane protein
MGDLEFRQWAERLMQTGVGSLSRRDRHELERLFKRIDRAQAARLGETAPLSLGERLADHVTRFGGSWQFIALFTALMIVWTLFNTELLGQRAFDPYPYVFLNLLLSMLTALQAPLIMMSQNRQAARDRVAAARDYETNLRAELKVDQLIAMVRDEQARR